MQVQLELEGLLDKQDDLKKNDSLKVNIPHIIKYMGSKKPIIDFITNSISEIHINDNYVCDLFAGSCSISAALKKDYNFISNDIQDYSRILAHTYFSDLSMFTYEELIELIEDAARIHVLRFTENYNNLFIDYSKINSTEEYQRIELLQRNLLEGGQFNFDYYLFTKYYSGTYWSFEQCVWIDALRKVADNFIDSSVYYSILSSIMYAMSYAAQSTGHFAQYRDGNSPEAVNDILLYRQKDVFTLFKRKLQELASCLNNSVKELIAYTNSFESCLENIPEGTTVYADPPYAPVHYSRFYHALETLIKYDYPDIEHKGRYRNDRHQSDFSQKTKALKAFGTLFNGIITKNSQMILSYSSTGVVPINDIIALGNELYANEKYEIIVRTFDHKHSTMGRFEDRDRDVVEYLIIAKFR